MSKLRVLDLFSGIGGFSLGLERTGGFETVAFCEIEEFPRKVLAKHWPEVPQFADVRKLTKDDLDGPIDVICGGYPCQPFSSAGKRRGKDDDRHLWPEFNRLVAELRPSWVIGENVAGHVSMGLDDVLSDLEGQEYACRPFVIPACAVDAKHKRNRTWAVAYAKNNGQSICGAWDERRNDCEARKFGVRAEFSRSHSSRHAKAMAYAERIRCGQVVASKFVGTATEGAASEAEYSGSAGGWARWLPEPAVGRVANGVSGRVDRLRALGNAVVPQIPELIGRAILAAEQEARL